MRMWLKLWCFDASPPNILLPSIWMGRGSKGSEGLDKMEGSSEGTIYVNFRLRNIHQVLNVVTTSCNTTPNSGSILRTNPDPTPRLIPEFPICTTLYHSISDPQIPPFVLEPAKTIGVWNVHAITKSLTVMSWIRRDIKPLLQHNSGNNLIFVPWLQSIDTVYVDGSQESNTFFSSKEWTTQLRSVWYTVTEHHSEWCVLSWFISASACFTYKLAASSHPNSHQFLFLIHLVNYYHGHALRRYCIAVHSFSLLRP